MRRIFRTLLLAVMLLPSVALSQSESFKALAAEPGNAWLQNEIGILHANGSGYPQSYTEAVKWYRLAAMRGHARAQSNLGSAYANGNGVPQLDAEAVRWFRLAAAGGDEVGQSNLGSMYHYGKGVPQNAVMAYVWFSLAAAQGNEPAMRSRRIIEQQLTPDQLARGQDIAARCFASGYKDCN